MGSCAGIKERIDCCTGTYRMTGRVLERDGKTRRRTLKATVASVIVIAWIILLSNSPRNSASISLDYMT